MLFDSLVICLIDYFHRYWFSDSHLRTALLVTFIFQVNVLEIVLESHCLGLSFFRCSCLLKNVLTNGPKIARKLIENCRCDELE